MPDRGMETKMSDTATEQSQRRLTPHCGMRHVASTLLAVLAASALAGCGGSQPSSPAGTTSNSATQTTATSTSQAPTTSTSIASGGFQGVSQPSPLLNVPDNDVNQLSCTSDRFCAFVDQNGNVWTLAGNDWSGPSPTGLSSTAGVVCATRTFCVAYGGENASVYDGSNWTPAPYPGTGSLDSMSCPSSNFCMAVDGDGYAATLSGTTWSQPVAVVAGDGSGNALSLDDVSCPNTTFCMALDSSGNSQRWSNGSWTAAGMSVGPNALSDVPQLLSCATTTFCAAVDGSGGAYAWNGTAWTSQQVAGSAALEAIDCPQAGICAAVGGSGGVGNEASLANGTWTVHQGVSPNEQLAAVACGGSLSCLDLSVYGHVSAVNLGQ